MGQRSKKYLQYFYLSVSVHRITFLAVVSFLTKIIRNQSIDRSISQVLEDSVWNSGAKISVLFLFVSQYTLNNTIQQQKKIFGVHCPTNKNSTDFFCIKKAVPP